MRTWWLSEWEQKINFLLFCSPVARFLTIYDFKNRVFDKKYTFGEFDMSKNMEMCHFSEKKAPAGATTD